MSGLLLPTHFRTLLLYIMRVRSWCFTENNYEGLPDMPSLATYLVYQEEVGEEFTPHLQGFVHYSQPRSLAQMRLDFPGSHLSPARDVAGSIAYCQKEEGRLGGPYLFGTPPGQGVRTDLMNVKRSIDEGASDEKLWEEHFSNMVRYNKGINMYKSIKHNSIQRTWKTRTLLICGPAGKQKSTLASLLAPYLGSSVYYVPESKASGIYFDGYDGQEVVILDEMDGNRMKPTLFNLIADKFSATVPVTARPAVNWCPRVLIVISNYHPAFWWKKRSVDQQKQTTRRIDLVIPRCHAPVYVVNPVHGVATAPMMVCSFDKYM